MNIGYRPAEIRGPQPLRGVERPAFHVFIGEDDLARVCREATLVPPPNWEQEFVVLAQREECPTGGYTVRLESVTRPRPDRLVIRLRFRDPKPDEFVTLAVTFPRVAAIIGRAGLEGVREIVFEDQKGRALHTDKVSL